jgi:integrating conjugative element protein (TIGR03759 family)
MQGKTKTCVATVVVILAIGSVASAQEGNTRRDTTITETRQIELSQSELERANAWSLNETEWRRYRSLLQGIRGSVSPATLSPIEVLGIHARDAAERRQYAERWAIAMHEDAERILAFQRAYDDAAKRLYPGQRLIDTAGLYGGTAQVTELQSGDRILLRVSLDCPSCDAALARAIKRLDDVAGIDIYVVDAGESQQDRIRNWAKAQGIQPEWVRSRRVTLNIDGQPIGGARGDESLPTLYIKRGERIERFAYAAL